MDLEKQINFELVRPSQEHARVVMAWRNDAQTLLNSFHSEPKSEEAFLSEFYSRYFCFPALPPLFACHSGVRIAFLRFDPCEDFTWDGQGRAKRCCAVSINVAPESRGKGLGSAILQSVQPWIQQQGFDALFGEVKADNSASQKAFLRAGFRALPECIKMVDERHPQRVVRYVADLVPMKTAASHVLVVAEAGSNWRMGTPSRDLAMAKTLIAIAAEAKADIVKFQVFRPESIYVKNAGAPGYLEDSGVHESMETLFSDLMMPYEMIEELHNECQRLNVEFMATPFSEADFQAVDPFVKRHKIASYELNHPHLLALVAKSRKPLFLSTGASNEEEIAWAVDTFHAQGGANLTLLQCTACYPAPVASMNLNVLPWLKQRFKVTVGLSDHSLDPLCAPISAVALGATVIEKHFTLDRKLPGPDHPFALMPQELKQLVDGVRNAEQMGGAFVKSVDWSERELRHFARRGVQAIQAIPEGTLLQEGVNVAILRPGRQPLGVHPKYLSEIEGKGAKRSLQEGEGLSFGDWL